MPSLKTHLLYLVLVYSPRTALAPLDEADWERCQSLATSRHHSDPDIVKWPSWHTQGGILEHFSEKKAWPSRMLEPNYAVGKLMLMYAMENICKIAAHPGDRGLMLL
ncbi:hypothetical protein F4801DRAFT_529567 [Xylaria longipes]|nr:hypothetical protein F4801DRAFT_529567 [Xylaria longipes]